MRAARRCVTAHINPPSHIEYTHSWCSACSGQAFRIARTFFTLTTRCILRRARGARRARAAQSCACRGTIVAVGRTMSHGISCSPTQASLAWNMAFNTRQRGHYLPFMRLWHRSNKVDSPDAASISEAPLVGRHGPDRNDRHWCWDRHAQAKRRPSSSPMSSWPKVPWSRPRPNPTS